MGKKVIVRNPKRPTGDITKPHLKQFVGGQWNGEVEGEWAVWPRGPEPLVEAFQEAIKNKRTR